MTNGNLLNGRRLMRVLMLIPWLPWNPVLADDTAPAAPADSATAPVAAPAVAASSPFTANLALVSQYVTRGMRQTFRQPAIQGGFDYNSASGVFVGTWLSNVSSKVLDNATLEWDLYGGYGGELGPVRYSATVFYYYYPGAHTSEATGNTHYNFAEFIPSLSYKFLTVKYFVTVTQNFFGYDSNTLGGPPGRHSRGSGYAQVEGNFDLPYGTTGLLHYGFQQVQNFEQSNFQDIKIALSKSFAGGWNIGVAFTKGFDKHNYYHEYTNTEPGAPTSDPLVSTVVFSLGRIF